MHLRFDAGTLLFDAGTASGRARSSVADGRSVDSVGDVFADLGALPGVRYDPRVGSWRARACDRDAILRELARRDIPVVDDTRRALPPPVPFPIPSLRPYQEASLDAWDRAQRRGIVVLPTGAGKTHVAIAAIARARCRALVLVPTRVLLEQWHLALLDAGCAHVGRYGDRHHDLASITVATMDAAWRWMHMIGDAFDFLIIDEVHRIAGEGRSEALEMSTAALRLGLTATPPDVDSAARITRLVGDVVHASSVEELAGTYLSAFEIVVVPVELLRAEREVYDRWMQIYRAWADDERFVEPSIDYATLMRRARKTPEGRAAMDALRRAHGVLAFTSQKRAALARLLEEQRGKKLLVFTADNKTAYAVARDHLIAPITCDVPREERKLTLERFRTGELRALVSAQVLNEGVDVPDAEIAIVVGGRAGPREHVQRVGRILRPSPGKRAIVFELVARHTTEERRGTRRRAPLAGAASRDNSGDRGAAWRDDGGTLGTLAAPGRNDRDGRGGTLGTLAASGRNDRDGRDGRDERRESRERNDSDG